MKPAETEELLNYKWLMEEEIKLILKNIAQVEHELDESINNTGSERLEHALLLADLVRANERKRYDELLRDYDALLKRLEEE